MKKWRVEAMASPITCLVTLHGIGFEQPPQPGFKNSGYADLLHVHLNKCLDTMLSDDPNREREQRGENGAIYVESRWLTATGIASREEGLKRLGSWSEDRQLIETKDAPLVANGECVSHIALVYSNLEPKEPELGAALTTLGMSLFSVLHYAHASGLLHMALTDIQAMIGHHTAAADQKTASSRPRTDLGSRFARQQGQQEQAAPPPSPGLMTAFRYLEEDVACYVCHNEERERVRSFVFEALLRLASRHDVGAIVLNTHSNGTVIALDIIRNLPPPAAAKIKAFITAGSPLRKYIDLFHWGQQIERLDPIKPWYNFWDEYDPVADPLEPPLTWRRGDKIVSPYDPKLFSLINPDNGTPSNIEVTDIKVDNVHKSSGGGLQAHNYWDNEEQFVKQLADIVCAKANN
jgi:hypothetical protein